MTEASAELQLLVWSVLLTFVLILVPATQSVLTNGLKVMAGPRDAVPEPGVSNQWTVLGCQLFLGGRIVHALVYAFGVPWIRPVFWGVAVAGMGMIAWQLLCTG